MTPPLVATYRFQLRDGVGFDDVAARIPWLIDLGVSHIYLAPIFRARTGSTHGYDVVDPNEVDEVLGGAEGFARLSAAAHQAGLGIVLDIVPNHMAFAPENPYLRDVLKHGRDSKYAKVFDIDWDAGPLFFPTLGAPLAELAAHGQISIDTDSAEPCLRVYDHSFPLRDGTDLPANIETPDVSALERVIAAQHWRLGHWRDDAHRIVHRRFFNITDLIGVRQEDQEVFELTHRWIFSEIAAGRIDGLRVDHIDGLARPGAYLERLRAGAGDIPIWAEKIVKPGEKLPDWPIEGLSGYEFIAPATRFLTATDGLAVIRKAARGAVPDDYHAEVRAVRRTLLKTVFRPERDRLTAAAVAALASGADASSDQADIERAIAVLAEYWPVYRSYTSDGISNRELLDAVGAEIRKNGTQSGALQQVEQLFEASGEAADVFRARFEQLTGALTAKSEEDTVFYRNVAYLPFCEVGLDPAADALGLGGFETEMKERSHRAPMALSTLTTHDTKRSADARAVILALSHLPDLAASLYAEARAEARQRGLPESLGVYCLQIALIMHNAAAARERIGAHLSKALREAKQLSTHEDPDESLERAAAVLCLDLHRALGHADGLWSEDQASRFEAKFDSLALIQAALQLTAPGVPDIYQGTEVFDVMLTDPDNRRAVDWRWIEENAHCPERRLAGEKCDMTRHLLALRRADPELFTHGEYALEIEKDGTLTVVRRLDGRERRIGLDRKAEAWPNYDPD